MMEKCVRDKKLPLVLLNIDQNIKNKSTEAYSIIQNQDYTNGDYL